MKKLFFSLDANSLQSIESASDYVDSRSLSANTAKSFNKPTGTTKINFTQPFQVGDTVTFGTLNSGSDGVTIAFVASGASGDQVNVSGTLATDTASLITKLNAAATRLSISGTFSSADAGASILFTATKSATPISANAKVTAGVVTVTPTTGARFCRLSAGTLFYYAVGGTIATAAAVDVSNGSGSISVPATVQPFFCVDDVAATNAISVVAPTSAVVSAEWWS